MGRLRMLMYLNIMHGIHTVKELTKDMEQVNSALMRQGEIQGKNL